ncbi:hypothetical protein NOZE110980_17535 [Nocardioides zeicaulis]
MGAEGRPGSRSGLPHRFEAVGEALSSGSDGLDACAVLGEELARDGASLEEALDGLRQAAWHAVGTEPSYDMVAAMVLAWGETTLGYLHQLSCDDPLTGLASQAHLRSRLAELHRLGGDAVRDHALVVCSVPVGDDPSDDVGDHFTRAMRLARTGESARTVFARDETIARLGTRRVVVLTRRDTMLGRRAGVLRTLLGGGDPSGGVRVWIEGVPPSDEGTGMLLDDLARG